MEINWSIVLFIAFLAEFLTIVGRFCFKMSTKKVLISIMKKLHLKKVVHFHHGFTGIIIMIIAYVYASPLFFNIGLGLLISDIIHHFIVLQLVMGNPEFHALYKNADAMSKEAQKEHEQFHQFYQHLIHHT